MGQRGSGNVQIPVLLVFGPGALRQGVPYVLAQGRSKVSEIKVSRKHQRVLCTRHFYHLHTISAYFVEVRKVNLKS